MNNPNASLVNVAFIKLGVVVLFIVLNTIFLTMNGWMDLCWDGMVNLVAIKACRALSLDLMEPSCTKQILPLHSP
eukprot:scaffold13321_cov193-Alexandrium_tamarense.AAC.12